MASIRYNAIVTNLTERLTIEVKRFKYFKAHLAVEIQDYSCMSLPGCHMPLTLKEPFFFHECSLSLAST